MKKNNVVLSNPIVASEGLKLLFCQHGPVQCTGPKETIERIAENLKIISVKTLGKYRCYLPKRSTFHITDGSTSYTHCKNGQAMVTGPRGKLESIIGDTGSKIYYVKSLKKYRVKLPKGYSLSV